MKASSRNSLLLAAFCACLSLCAAAQEYFVAPGGDDANPGTLEKPVKSPVRAVKKLKPGDTLYFRAGEYRCKTDSVIGLAPPCSGEEGKPITFRNYGDEHVKLDCTGSDWGLTANGWSWIVFDGFEVTNSTHYGMKLSSGRGGGKGGERRHSDHVTIRNCEVHGTPMECIFVSDTGHLLVENCHLHHSKTSHGIYVSRDSDNAVIRNVTSEHNHGNSGVQLNAHDNDINNALVENCILRYNAHGFSLMGVIDSRFRNNLLFNNGYDGPRGSGGREIILKDGSMGKNGKKNGLKGTFSRGNTFENNTVVNLEPEGHSIRRILDANEGVVSDCTFRNNIMVTRKSAVLELASFAGFVFEDNCLFSITGGDEMRGGGSLADFAAAKGFKASGTVTKDPMFVNPESGDLRLKPGSPCAGAGVRPEAWEKLGCRLPWKRSAEAKR